MALLENIIYDTSKLLKVTFFHDLDNFRNFEMLLILKFNKLLAFLPERQKRLWVKPKIRDKNLPA